jgi:hypothetical protein
MAKKTMIKKLQHKVHERKRITEVKEETRTIRERLNLQNLSDFAFIAA